jgi:hypothetical protein
MYSRKRVNVVRDIRRVYAWDNLFAPLHYDKTFCRAGSVFAHSLSIGAIRAKYGIDCMLFSVLFAASELEDKTGFIAQSAFIGYLGRVRVCKMFGVLIDKGLFAPAPFPLQYSHIKRVCKNYTVTDKGRECIAYFRKEYLRHVKRERKRAPVDVFSK